MQSPPSLRQPPPLTCAVVVCRSSPGVEPLPHVVERVSGFIDHATPERWSIARACEHGSLRLVQRVAAREPPSRREAYYMEFLASKGLVAAVKNDNLEIVQWLCTKYCPSLIPTKGIQEAVKLSKLRVLEWLFSHYESDSFWTHKITDLAIEHGRLDILQWIIPQINDVKYVARRLHTAAGFGRFEMVKWLHEQTRLQSPSALPPGASYVPVRMLCMHKSLDIARFFFNLGYCDAQGRPRESGRSGDLDFVNWLNTLRLDGFGATWIDIAAAGGHLHLVQLSVGNLAEGDCTAKAMDDAAKNGHLQVVKWLHQNRVEGCTTSAMNGAAGSGHLEIVQWLHANRVEGCTVAAIDRAAASGHFEVVKWLHENRTEGCTTLAMDQAARIGHLEIVKWLHENRSEGCTADAMNDAARGGHLDVVKWLHENRSEGCTTRAMDLAAKCAHLHVVKWLHDNRSEGCTTAAMDKAGSLEMAQWLHENRSEGCTNQAMENAARKGLFDVLIFVYNKYRHGYTDFMARSAFHNCNFMIFMWIRAAYPGQVDLRGIAEACPEAFDEFMGATKSPVTAKRRKLSLHG